MTMQTRHYIAPRVQAMQLRARLKSKELSPTELKAVLSALKLTGIPDAATRFMEDAARFSLSELIDSM